MLICTHQREIKAKELSLFIDEEISFFYIQLSYK